MFHRSVRRSLALAAASTLLVAGVAQADGVAVDGDAVSPGVQTFVDLGTATPGGTVNRDVTLWMSCSGLSHVDPGQLVVASQGIVTVPTDGSISATDVTLGPVPTAWPDDSAGIIGCPEPMSIGSNGPSHVTIVAPTTPGLDYAFTLQYDRTLSPAGVSDGSSVSGFTIITFMLDVVEGSADTTPPVLTDVPADLDMVTEDPAGAALDYAMPSATDDQDPAPTVACDPAPGDVAPIGTTTVTCTATDAAGNAAVAAFDVTVHLASVNWENPVGGGLDRATRGSSVPLKVTAWLDGQPASGSAVFAVQSCGPGPSAVEASVAATWQTDPERWMAVLDTSGLTDGCHRVALVVEGASVGSFGLEIVDPGNSTAALARGRNRLS
jgi:HYR domain